MEKCCIRSYSPSWPWTGTRELKEQYKKFINLIKAVALKCYHNKCCLNIGVNCFVPQSSVLASRYLHILVFVNIQDHSLALYYSYGTMIFFISLSWALGRSEGSIMTEPKAQSKREFSTYASLPLDVRTYYYSL